MQSPDSPRYQRGEPGGLPDQPELVGGGAQDALHGLVDRVGEEEPVAVGGEDRLLRDHAMTEEVVQRLPVVGAHQDQGEVLDLAGLDQRRALEDLVHGAEAAGQHHEGVGVFDQHHLADEEVAELDPAVEVGVGLLLAGAG